MRKILSICGFIGMVFIPLATFSQEDRPVIYRSNGQVAIDSTVFATNEGSRVQLVNKSKGGNFDPRLVRKPGVVYEALSSDSVAHVLGKTSMVLSEDGQTARCSSAL